MAEIGQEPTFSYLTDRSFGQRLDSETCPLANACKSAEAASQADWSKCPVFGAYRSTLKFSGRPKVARSDAFGRSAGTQG